MVLRGRRRTSTLGEAGPRSWLLAFCEKGIGSPRFPLLGLALAVPTELTDALCVGGGGFGVGRRIVSAKRDGGELTGLEGNLDGVPSSEVFGPSVWPICEETVILTVRTLSSGRDSRISAPVHQSLLLCYDSDLEQMVTKRRKKSFAGREEKKGVRGGKLARVEGNLDGLHE